MQRHSDLILLVHPKHQNVSDLVYYFHTENHAWEEAHGLEEASRRASCGAFSLIVCCWEQLHGSPENRSQQDDIEGLLASSTPLIFLSENQSAAVTFKTFAGRCFYSLRKTDFAQLFAIIAELAIHIQEDRDRNPLLRRDEQPAFGATVPAPHFLPTFIFDRAMINSSIQSLF